MSGVLTEISGNETMEDPASPIAALIAFYRAFNAGDLDGLARNWLEGGEPSMSNPVGGLRRGWPEIRDGYARLFGGVARVQVAFHDFTVHEDNGACVFVGREKGACESPSGRLALRIRTTRWFVRRNGMWRQLHHHGSIEAPALLAAYQKVIFGAPIDTRPL
ncbi:MAG TPA: nuclear transport factor 2 family protein [Acidocella sp.]|jgi:ketosteroid isomerase-like protein|uniref:YybH family protein n=1 Tax=Acidocella sp. TaxID=50710 RepID=UPI002C2A9905|nr:nuclear transport factor 2 family protein [Acidocella sp.]HVE22341.1 nuclear transport factor 2 family protein [Acidocella sp.]